MPLNEIISPIDRVQREKTVILAILTQISQNMLLYNFDVIQIRDIM